MRTQRIRLAILVAVVFIAFGAAWFFWPKGQDARGSISGDAAARPDEPAHRTHAAERGAPAAEKAPEGRGAHDHAHLDHEHGEEAGSGRDLDMSVEEILAARCEHEIPTHRCAMCRYEVGVVKVDPSLMRDAAGRGDGLFKPVSVARGEVDTVLNATGEIQLNGNAAAHITPRVSGVIRSMQVDIGTKVSMDQVLFEIESVELGQALSEYRKALALTELSRKNLEREKSLFARKISSERDVIEAQMSHEQNQAELEAVEQRLHVFGLKDRDLASIRPDANGILVGRLPVRAPLGGTIIEKHGVVGEVVDPGRDVLLLADLSTVWVWAHIYEKDMRLLLENKRNPTPVKVSVHAFPGRAFGGVIDYIGDTMDEETRTVRVRVTVDNDQGLLRPGMFCGIQILVASGREVLAVPKVALLSDEGRDFVFVHLAEDYYLRREVKKGQELDDNVEIVAGLAPGQTIVADGAFLLKSDVLRSKMGAGCAD
ncbi:MAG: efflux RND transporter periplasmic adaptor subunit [bacterium]